MNKYIKKIVSILGDNPSYAQSDEARDYLQKVIISGEFKPKYSLQHTEKGSFDHGAITLPVSCLGENYKETVEFSEIKQEIEYTVYAQLCEDYYEWVNFFVCVSADGRDYVVGDFESVV